MSTLSLRPMQAADLNQVLAMAAASPEAPHWAAADYEPYLAADPATNPALPRIAIVAAQSDRIAGYAAATLRPETLSPATICELDSIAVHPQARRQGIGAALLRAVLAWAAARHARRLVLEVRSSNAPALGLYDRFGFRIEGRRPRYYTHPEEDALLLDKDITAGANPGPFSTAKPIERGRPRC